MRDQRGGMGAIGDTLRGLYAGTGSSAVPEALTDTLAKLGGDDAPQPERGADRGGASAQERPD
jgi:hypothetical protein